MRGKRNLGYVAGCNAMTTGQLKGLFIIINGENFIPNEIEQIMDQLLLDFYKNLDSISE